MAGTATNEDTNTTKGTSAGASQEVGKDEVIKAALDKLKESKKSDDESKGTVSGGEAREEPDTKLISDHKSEAKERDRDRDRERERERERPRSRDHERGRESDRERGRDDGEKDRDKAKERGHRSRDKGKDSGQFDL